MWEDTAHSVYQENIRLLLFIRAGLAAESAYSQVIDRKVFIYQPATKFANILYPFLILPGRCAERS